MTKLKRAGVGFVERRKKLIAVVKVESDDKNYRTMKVMRRNESFIVAMAFGS